MILKHLPARACTRLSLPLFLLLEISFPARAGTFSWSNASGNWTVGSSWAGGTAPFGLDPSDALTFGGDVGTTAGIAPNYAAFNDSGGDFLLNSLFLDATDAAGLATDPPMQFTGAGIRFAGTAPSITQNNAGGFTFDMKVASEQNLTLSGNGTGSTTFNLELSGLFDLTKNGTSTYRFGTPVPVPPATGVPSENTWTGRLTINDGTVRFNNNAFSGPTALRANPVTLNAPTATLSCSSELRLGTLSGTAGLVQSQVTGTNTPTEHLIVQAITPGSFGGIVRLGPPTGTGTAGGTFTVRGPGEQTLTGTLNINKDVAVGGRLTLAGTASLGTQTAGSIGMQGGLLKLDNSVTNNNNRLRDGSATSTGLETIGGGTFQLIGNSGGTAETIGRLQLGTATKTRSGQLNISVVHTAVAAPTVLTIGSLNRDTTTVSHTATVDFSAANAAGTALPLGQAGNTPRIIFSTPPLAANGLITNSAGTGAPGFATVNGADFAAHGTNGVAPVATGPWPAMSTAAANVLITASVSVPVTSFGINSLKIAPAAAAQTLTIASGRTLTCPGILLAGPQNFTLAGPGLLGGTGVHYYHVQQAILTVSAILPDQICVKAGSGILALTGSNNSNAQPLVIEAGAIRGQQGTTLPGGEIKFRGGILELTGGGTFSRNLGFAAGNLNWSEFDAVVPPGAISEDRGSGGFAAIGADVTVDLGAAGATLISWEDPGFVQSNSALILGSTRADGKVTMLDNFQLNSTEPTVKFSPREIRVIDNPALSTDDAIISGVISGAKYNDLLKTGDGNLELTGINTLAGAVWVQAGSLTVTGSTAAGIATEILTGATLAGNGSTSYLVLESGGKVAPGKNSQATLTANGCTWRSGGTMQFELSAAANTSDRLALGSGPLRRGSASGPFTFNFGGTGANNFTYTLATFGSTDFLASHFTAAGLAAGVTGYFQINGGNTLVFITGTPPPPPIESWRQSYFGPSATNSGPAANSADPDFDGLTNLDEYVLGSSPLAATASAAPAAGQSAGFMTLAFNRNPAATDVTILIESSSTLAAGVWTTEATWTSAAGWTHTAGTQVTEAAGRVTFRDAETIAAGRNRRFLRMRVTTP